MVTGQQYVENKIYLNNSMFLKCQHTEKMQDFYGNKIQTERTKLEKLNTLKVINNILKFQLVFKLNS